MGKLIQKSPLSEEIFNLTPFVAKLSSDLPYEVKVLDMPPTTYQMVGGYCTKIPGPISYENLTCVSNEKTSFGEVVASIISKTPIEVSHFIQGSTGSTIIGNKLEDLELSDNFVKTITLDGAPLDYPISQYTEENWRYRLSVGTANLTIDNNEVKSETIELFSLESLPTILLTSNDFYPYIQLLSGQLIELKAEQKLGGGVITLKQLFTAPLADNSFTLNSFNLNQSLMFNMDPGETSPYPYYYASTGASNENGDVVVAKLYVDGKEVGVNSSDTLSNKISLNNVEWYINKAVVSDGTFITPTGDTLEQGKAFIQFDLYCNSSDFIETKLTDAYLIGDFNDYNEWDFTYSLTVSNNYSRQITLTEPSVIEIHDLASAQQGMLEELPNIDLVVDNSAIDIAIRDSSGFQVHQIDPSGSSSSVTIQITETIRNGILTFTLSKVIEGGPGGGQGGQVTPEDSGVVRNLRKFRTTNLADASDGLFKGELSIELNEQYEPSTGWVADIKIESEYGLDDFEAQEEGGKYDKYSRYMVSKILTDPSPSVEKFRSISIYVPVDYEEFNEKCTPYTLQIYHINAEGAKQKILANIEEV